MQIKPALKPPDAGDPPNVITAADGARFYLAAAPAPLAPDMLGQPCVLWLADGRIVAAIPFAAGGGVALESWNGSPAIDAPVARAALLEQYMSPRAAQRLRHAAPQSASDRRAPARPGRACWAVA